MDRDALRNAISAARRAGKKIGLVPTMGALHRGHLSLVEAACRECDFTVVTIFVNPTQFGPGEDFEKYPRTLEADLAALAQLRVGIVFTPAADAMYSADHETFVDVGSVATPLEGTARPGHFRGVATVVLKLFQLVAADVAYFGQKDYQQTLVVRKLVDDLDVPVKIRVCPTLREADGLAMSSRNAYLSAADRSRALALSQSLQQAADRVAAGERDAKTIRTTIVEHLRAAGIDDVDYVELVRDGTVQPVDRIDGPTVALVAATVGETRLIDNRLLEF